MQYWEMPKYARELWTQASRLMEKTGLSPTPLNYEICFFYELGQNAELKAEFDAVVKSGALFDSARTQAFHKKYFEHDASAHLGDTGIRLHAELQRLAKALSETGEGASDYGRTLSSVSDMLTSVDASPQVRSLLDTVSTATHAMADRNRKLEAQVEESTKEVETLRATIDAVRKDSLQDSLTGLANRRCLDETLVTTIADAEEHGTPLSMLMCDIDHFKKFNDTWGHATGDQVLRLVAHCVRSNVKGRDTAARYGGEELAVVLPNTRLADATLVAEQIRRTVESRKIVKKATGESYGTITLSIGVSEHMPNGSVAELINRADACLYLAKRGGRNQVQSTLPATHELQLASNAPTAQNQKDVSSPKANATGAVFEIDFADKFTELFVDPEASLVDARLKNLLSWWNEKRGNAKPILWQSAFLNEIAFARDHIHVAELIDGHDSFQNIFVGKELNKVLGVDLTGMMLLARPHTNQKLAPSLTRVYEMNKLAVQMAIPLKTASKTAHVLPTGSFTGESLYLPFASNLKSVGYILTATILSPTS